MYSERTANEMQTSLLYTGKFPVEIIQLIFYNN